MNDRVRIVPFKGKDLLNLCPTLYKVQMKRVWLRVGPMKFFQWKTVGEYAAYDCAVLNAKNVVKCLNDEWKEVQDEE